MLLRVIGQGRMQHPFHEHANHVRVLARDGNLLLTSARANNLAGPLLFTTTTTPGMTFDGIFEFTGKGLNWDMYGHHAADAHERGRRIRVARPRCERLQHRQLRRRPANYYEWCARSRQAARGASLRQGRQRRPDDAARSEHPGERCLVRRQSLPRARRHRPRGRLARRFRPPARSPTIRAPRPGSPTCGTRITNARSRPTTSSRAE